MDNDWAQSHSHSATHLTCCLIDKAASLVRIQEWGAWDDRQESGRGFRPTDGCIHREKGMEGGGKGERSGGKEGGEPGRQIAVLYSPS